MIKALPPLLLHAPYASPEGEMSVLGAALQDAQAAKLAGELTQGDFTDVRHQAIHAAITNILRKGMPVDLVTAMQELGEMKATETAGGFAYLTTLCAYVPTAANVRTYIGILRECSARRQMYLLGQSLMQSAGDAMNEVEELREKTAVQIRDIRARDEVRLVSQRDAVMQTYLEAEEDARQAKEGYPDRIMTGIPRLDERLGGLHGSQLVIIGARPSVGKSVFALTICVNAAKKGKRVLFVTLEMTPQQITQRIMANESGVNLGNITTGKLGDDEWVGLAESLGTIGELPIFYTEDACTVPEIRKAAFQLYENGGLDLICVDYLQLTEAVWAKSHNRAEQVSEISRGLKKLTQELNIPVIAMTQLNRNSEDSRTGKKREPTMAEARESGSIEQDANIFILLHQPEESEMKNDIERDIWRSLNQKGQTMMRIIVDKNRQGTRGRSTIAFDGKHMRFLPITREEAPY